MAFLAYTPEHLGAIDDAMRKENTILDLEKNMTTTKSTAEKKEKKRKVYTKKQKKMYIAP